MAHKLKFNTNWNNKLFSNIFSTIRYDSYNIQPGQLVDIYLRVGTMHKLFCTTICINVFKMDFENIKYFWKLDTGYSNEDELEKLFKSFYMNDPDFKEHDFFLFILEKTNPVKVSIPKSLL